MINAVISSSRELFQTIFQIGVPTVAIAKQKPSEKHEKQPERTDNKPRDSVKMKECTIQFEPSGIKVRVPFGTTLLEVAHKAGIYLSSICGGEPHKVFN